MKPFIFLLLLSAPQASFSGWIPDGEVSYIVEIMTYGSDSSVFSFKLQSGQSCYLVSTDGENKKAYELIMNMKNFSKRGMFHCHENADNNGTGVPAHRLHRVIAY